MKVRWSIYDKSQKPEQDDNPDHQLENSSPVKNSSRKKIETVYRQNRDAEKLYIKLNKKLNGTAIYAPMGISLEELKKKLIDKNTLIRIILI